MQFEAPILICPWRLIIATRNRLIHGYLGIDKILSMLPLKFGVRTPIISTRQL